MTGRSDAVVVVPEATLGGGLTGQLLVALVAAGAFAAFLSTSSGLLTSVAGAISANVLGRGSVRGFRLSTLVAGLVPMALALNDSGLDVSQVVGPPLSGWPAALVAQPAAWTVPLAFTVMVTVSALTRYRVPGHVNATMLRLHAPETRHL